MINDCAECGKLIPCPDCDGTRDPSLTKRLSALEAENERLRAQLALVRADRPAAEYVCTNCDTTMRRWQDFPEYQHEGCGGLVRLRALFERDTALSDLARVREECERMRPVYEASIELRRAESTDVPGESIAELESNVPAAQRRSQLALIKWRSVVDAALTPKEP
jgi:hypothetical protein